MPSLFIYPVPQLMEPGSINPELMKNFLFLLTMLAFTACVHHNKTNEASNSQTARIAFSDTLHDFGICAEDKAVQQYLFIFKNTGDVPAAVVDVALSCHCLSADYTRGIVQPGDTGHVTLTYDGRGTSGYFNKKARVRFNSPRIHELYVKGEIISGQDKD